MDKRVGRTARKHKCLRRHCRVEKFSVGPLNTDFRQLTLLSINDLFCAAISTQRNYLCQGVASSAEGDNCILLICIYHIEKNVNVGVRRRLGLGLGLVASAEWRLNIHIETQKHDVTIDRESHKRCHCAVVLNYC